MRKQHIIPLDKQWITEQLIQKTYTEPFHLDCFPELPSTNTHLKLHAMPEGRTVCLAESQTAGRGRFGRHWSSPYGENIYLSMTWVYQGALVDLSGLSLILALVVRNLISERIGMVCKIKWPNDIVCNHQKMAGILVELNSDVEHHIQTIIGIGINVNTDTKKTPLSEHLHCSMLDLTGQLFDRNSLIVDLLLNLDEALQRFSVQGFSAFYSHWSEYDDLFYQPVRVHTAGHWVEGIAQGVNEQGLLILKTEDDRIHLLSSGEASLRSIPDAATTIPDLFAK